MPHSRQQQGGASSPLVFYRTLVGVLTDRVKRAADIVASIRRTLALNPQRQLYQGRL